MSESLSSDRVAPHWIRFSESMPRTGEFYWILSISWERMLAHYGLDKVWRSMNAGGDVFRLQDTYTHWTHIGEPPP